MGRHWQPPERPLCSKYSKNAFAAGTRSQTHFLMCLEPIERVRWLQMSFSPRWVAKSALLNLLAVFEGPLEGEGMRGKKGKRQGKGKGKRRDKHPWNKFLATALLAGNVQTDDGRTDGQTAALWRRNVMTINTRRQHDMRQGYRLENYV